MSASSPSFLIRHKTKLRAVLLGMILATVLTLVALVVGYWVIVPKIAEQTMRAKLHTLEQRGGLRVETGSIEPDGIRGVRVLDLHIYEELPSGDLELLQISQMRVGIDRARLLTGQKVVSSLQVEGATLAVHRDAEGEINLARILSRIRGSKAEREEEKEEETRGDAPSFLRYFGGVWPELDVRQVAITFTSEHSEPFPLTAMNMEKVLLSSSGDQADLDTTITLDLIEDARSPYILPREISTRGTLALPIEQSALAFTFDRPFTIASLPFYPELSLGLSDVELSEGGKISLSNLTLDAHAPGQPATRGDTKRAPLFDATRAVLRLERFTTRKEELRPLELSLDHPTLRVAYREDGSSNVSDLLDILTRNRDVPPPPPTPDDETVAAPPAPSRTERLLARLKDLDAVTLARLIPEKVDIVEGTVLIDDPRPLDLVRPAAHLELQHGALELQHDPERGSLAVSGGFEARAGEGGSEDRGGAHLDLSANYKTHLFKLEAKARELDLSWLAQLGGPRLSDDLKGGVLRAELKVEQPAKGAPFDFEGDLSIEQGHVLIERLAEEPLQDWSLGYAFKGYYDPNAAIPEAKLLKSALDANVPEDPDADTTKSSRVITERPPERGALVFTRGKLRAGEVRAEVRPALYGLDRHKPLPARLDLAVNMPLTPIQSVLDAMPQALLGDISGARLSGDVKMDFLAEVPLYDASEMVWRGEPEAVGAEIVSLPKEVDVRQMVEPFRHTILDESVLYERTVRIPDMTLTPTQWLIDNAGLTLEQIDDHWREGGWFVSRPLDRDESLDAFWNSPQLRWKAPSKPWITRDDPRIVRYWKPYKKGQTEPMVSEPYGPYFYVPLHHISPWLVRAILTTEDNSFFKHDGFNRLAMRQSIERNLAEGEYARGASTISMQLIKNLYLTRKKVMSRKIQEALLVWMMEDVVHVPKARMLEIYLNIIEFAPGVFGIHDAAVHYFGKRPDELTLAECAWLVTIVPGPKKFHSHWMRGEMSDSSFERIKRYMKIMHNRERVTEAELAEASLVKPAFFHPELKQPALAPLPDVSGASGLESLFPELFNDSPLGTKPPAGNAPIKSDEDDDSLDLLPTLTPRPEGRPVPSRPVTPPPRATPDPPPTLRLR